MRFMLELVLIWLGFLVLSFMLETLILRYLVLVFYKVSKGLVVGFFYDDLL